MIYVEYEAQSTLYNLQDKIKHMANHFRPACLLILALCGCSMLVNQTKPANADDAACNTDTGKNAETFHQKQPAARFKLPQEWNLYHSDSEGLRQKHLDSTHNGSTHLDNEYHDKTRLPGHLKNKTLYDGLQSKPVIPWTRFQFILNDRWQLGADLPDLQNLVSDDGHGSFVPIPRLTYDFGPVKLSSLYIPQIQDYNPTSVMGLYLIIKF